jgi:SAM-dependent methyltransferase
MSIDRSKRITFENVADIYDEVRTGYPEELVEDILGLSGLPSNGRILEIGCGPGNATISFARRGYRILAVELGERLCAVAADSFHWIPPEVGYAKVAGALKDSGSAAFFWRVPVDAKTDLSRAIDSVYQQTAPQFINPDKRFTAEWLVGVILENFRASGRFGEVTTKQYSWSETLSGEQVIKGLRTCSMHQGIDEVMRDKLYASIGKVIEGFGGKVTQPRSVVLFHSRVKR